MIGRKVKESDHAVASGATNTGSLPTVWGAIGAILVPTGWDGGTTFTWQASFDEGSTWFAIVDSSATAVTSTVAAAKACPIPAEAMAYEYVRATFTATSTALTIKMIVKG